jgi:cyclophilin family peptidyl-prolyl cis-trans isomerase
MDNETKATYGIIAALIIFLGGFAYMLQPVEAPESQKSNYATTTTVKSTTVPVAQGTSTTNTNVTTNTTMEQSTFTHSTITTNKGVIEIELLKETPATTKNFGTLAQANFYNGVRFHRVIKDFMIQTGDPLSKDTANAQSWGTGGPGYKFNDELTGKEQYPLGTVAMANSGPNTNGSQFFIVTANPSVALPPSYTVFGKVTKGIEVALAIQEVATTPSDRPLEDVIITKVEVK